MEQRYLIVIGGATAVGKTAFAVRAALHFQTEILSADSRQFYREMQIGTAKPSKAELALVKHHFIDSLSIHDAYSVGDFERDAMVCLDKLYETHAVAVMAGGAGLYIKAVCDGLDAFPTVPEHVRKEVLDLYERQGMASLQAELKRVDPVYYDEVDTKNPARLIRALSVCRAGGMPFSSYRKQKAVHRSFEPIYVQLDHPREVLYRRIDQRVDDMMRQGLEEEARRLYPFRHLPALQTVGYQELFDYFDEKTSIETAVELIRRHSRNYAKRQLTWMRRYGNWQPFHPEQWEVFLDFAGKKMNNSVR